MTQFSDALECSIFHFQAPNPELASHTIRVTVSPGTGADTTGGVSSATFVMPANLPQDLVSVCPLHAPSTETVAKAVIVPEAGFGTFTVTAKSIEARRAIPFTIRVIQLTDEGAIEIGTSTFRVNVEQLVLHDKCKGCRVTVGSLGQVGLQLAVSAADRMGFYQRLCERLKLEKGSDGVAEKIVGAPGANEAFVFAQIRRKANPTADVLRVQKYVATYRLDTKAAAKALEDWKLHEYKLLAVLCMAHGPEPTDVPFLSRVSAFCVTHNLDLHQTLRLVVTHCGHPELAHLDDDSLIEEADAAFATEAERDAAVAVLLERYGVAEDPPSTYLYPTANRPTQQRSGARLTATATPRVASSTNSSPRNAPPAANAAAQPSAAELATEPRGQPTLSSAPSSAQEVLEHQQQQRVDWSRDVSPIKSTLPRKVVTAALARSESESSAAAERQHTQEQRESRGPSPSAPTVALAFKGGQRTPSPAIQAVAAGEFGAAVPKQSVVAAAPTATNTRQAAVSQVSAPVSTSSVGVQARPSTAPAETSVMIVTRHAEIQVDPPTIAKFEGASADARRKAAASARGVPRQDASVQADAGKAPPVLIAVPAGISKTTTAALSRGVRAERVWAAVAEVAAQYCVGEGWLMTATDADLRAFVSDTRVSAEVLQRVNAAGNAVAVTLDDTCRDVVDARDAALRSAVTIEPVTVATDPTFAALLSNFNAACRSGFGTVPNSALRFDAAMGLRIRSSVLDGAFERHVTLQRAHRGGGGSSGAAVARHGDMVRCFTWCPDVAAASQVATSGVRASVDAPLVFRSPVDIRSAAVAHSAGLSVPPEAGIVRAHGTHCDPPPMWLGGSQTTADGSSGGAASTGLLLETVHPLAAPVGALLVCDVYVGEPYRTVMSSVPSGVTLRAQLDTPFEWPADGDSNGAKPRTGDDGTAVWAKATGAVYDSAILRHGTPSECIAVFSPQQVTVVAVLVGQWQHPPAVATSTQPPTQTSDRSPVMLAAKRSTVTPYSSGSTSENALPPVLRSSSPEARAPWRHASLSSDASATALDMQRQPTYHHHQLSVRDLDASTLILLDAAGQLDPSTASNARGTLRPGTWSQALSPVLTSSPRTATNASARSSHRQFGETTAPAPGAALPTYSNADATFAQQVREGIAKAWRLFRSGNVRDATRMWNELGELPRDHAAGPEEVAARIEAVGIEAEAVQRNVQAAVEHYVAALSAFEASPSVLFRLGNLHEVALHDLTRALAYFRKAADLGDGAAQRRAQLLQRRIAVGTV